MSNQFNIDEMKLIEEKKCESISVYNSFEDKWKDKSIK